MPNRRATPPGKDVPRKPVLVRPQRRSLEEQVYQALKSAILTGRLGPGAPLIESQLAAELEVSKTPVREALIRLRFEGLVRVEKYRGASVIDPTPADVAEICQLRGWIEGGIVRELAARPPSEVVANLRGSIEDARRALECGDEEAYLEGIRRFDKILIEASENRRAARVASDLADVLAVIGVAAEDVPGRRERSIKEHEAVLAALEHGDRDKAHAALLAHISSVERDFRKFAAARQSAVARHPILLRR